MQLHYAPPITPPPQPHPLPHIAPNIRMDTLKAMGKDKHTNTCNSGLYSLHMEDMFQACLKKGANGTPPPTEDTLLSNKLLKVLDENTRGLLPEDEQQSGVAIFLAINTLAEVPKSLNKLEFLCKQWMHLKMCKTEIIVAYTAQAQAEAKVLEDRDFLYHKKF
eukprot:12463552-Ditylum_brightwellii.AAC.1